MNDFRLTLLLCFCQFLSFAFFQGLSVFQNRHDNVSCKNEVRGADGSYGSIIMVACVPRGKWCPSIIYSSTVPPHM